MLFLHIVFRLRLRKKEFRNEFCHTEFSKIEARFEFDDLYKVVSEWWA